MEEFKDFHSARKSRDKFTTHNQQSRVAFRKVKFVEGIAMMSVIVTPTKRKETAADAFSSRVRIIALYRSLSGGCNKFSGATQLSTITHPPVCDLELELGIPMPLMSEKIPWKFRSFQKCSSPSGTARPQNEHETTAEGRYTGLRY